MARKSLFNVFIKGQLPTGLLGPLGSLNRVTEPQRRNYSAASNLIIAGGIGALSATVEMGQKNIFGKKQVTLVTQSNWLSNVKPEWLHLSWGQPVKYLPPGLIAIFLKLFPQMMLESQVSFGQMKDFLTHLKELELPKAGIKCICTPMTNLIQTKSGLVLMTNNGQETLSYDNDFHLISSIKNLRHPFFGNNVPMSCFGALYSLSPSEIKNVGLIGVLGSGQNLKWALRDLKASGAQIINFLPPGEITRQEALKDPTCRAIFKIDDPHFIYTLEPNGMVLVAGIDLKTDKELKFQIHENHFYSATGLVLDKSAVGVHRDKVTFVDTSPKPEDLITYTCSDGLKKNYFLDGRGTLMPPGNLVHSIYAHMYALRELKTYPIHITQALLANRHAWEQEVRSALQKLGYHPPINYFAVLFQNINKMTTDRLPNGPEVWAVIKAEFEKKPIPGLRIEIVQDLFVKSYTKHLAKFGEQLNEDHRLGPRLSQIRK